MFNKSLRGSWSILLFSILVVFSKCTQKSDQYPQPVESKWVEKVIKSNAGGTLATSDSIRLIIPPNALPADGNVSLGITGNEPKSIPNENLQIIGVPFTVRFPTDSIRKTVQVSFLASGLPIDTSTCIILLYNGNTYFPVEYSMTGDKVFVLIDQINWENDVVKGSKLLGEIIILTAIIKQTPPLSQWGLNKVTINGGEMKFDPPTANSTSKVLLLIHGWTGDASGWINFIPKITNDNSLNYSEIWTFVYNSSWSIKTNARNLADKLSSFPKGVKIDIVAHSMGGLVARSMIEQFDGTRYVNKLITLGTPHMGSPLAVYRYVLGGIVGLDAKLNEVLGFPWSNLNIVIYNCFTQGFRDLNPDSNFLYELKNVDHQPVTYYVLASANDPHASPIGLLEKVAKILSTSDILPGDDDGIVTVASAKSVTDAVFPEKEFNIPKILAHLAMIDDSSIDDQVLEYLRIIEPVIPTNPNEIVFNPNLAYGTISDVDGNNYKTIQIGTQTWMAENLKTTKYNDNTLIPLVTDDKAWRSLTTPGYCWYNNDEATFKPAYGALYNWYVVDILSNGGKNVCPDGWHVPTDSQWSVLTDFLTNNGYGIGANGYIAKSMASQSGWSTTTGTNYIGSNMAINNSSGFTALPSGSRLAGDMGWYGGFGSECCWWSASEYPQVFAWTRGIRYYAFTVYKVYDRRQRGFSVRCLKDY